MKIYLAVISLIILNFPILTQAENSISNNKLEKAYLEVDKSDWKSINYFLKIYGSEKNEKTNDVYAALFSLKNKASFPRTEKQFEKDIMNYDRNYSNFIKISVLEERATNPKKIETLPNTPININLRTNDIVIILKADLENDLPYKIKHDHKIKVKATLTVTKSMDGIMGMFYEPDYNEYDIIFPMTLKEGKNNPQEINYNSITSGMGFPLFESALGAKSNVKYSFKYKILEIEE